MYADIVIAGFGGQGILLIGNLLAESALVEDYNVTFLPVYGVEMRGGTANCTVVISDEEIGSPEVSVPESLIIMSEPARAKYEPRLKQNGLLILNSSLVDRERVERKDIQLLAFPLNQIALEMGDLRLANMLALGLYLGRCPVVKLESVSIAMEEFFGEQKKRFISQNLSAIKRGIELSQG